MNQPVHGRRRLRNVDKSGRRRQIHVVTPARPCQQRIPALLLALDQLGRPFGTIASEVSFGVTAEPGGKRLTIGRDPVDRGVREAGKRHPAGVDLVTDEAPFFRDGIGKSPAWAAKGGARRSPYRAAIKPDRPSCVVPLDRNLFPESPHGGGFCWS